MRREAAAQRLRPKKPYRKWFPRRRERGAYPARTLAGIRASLTELAADSESMGVRTGKEPARSGRISAYMTKPYSVGGTPSDLVRREDGILARWVAGEVHLAGVG